MYWVCDCFLLNHVAIVSTNGNLTFPKINDHFVYLKNGPLLPTGIELWTYSQVEAFALISGRSKKAEFATEVLVTHDAR